MSHIFKKLALALLFMALLLPATQALANKSVVAIVAPDAAAKGTEITIKLNVTHSGNNMFHHTNWVYLVVNGKEAARWEFSAFDLPKDENFTLEFKLIVEEAMQLEALANCNLHGSTGKVFQTINLK